MSYRFAPSPSGDLHFGNARIAVFNALLALQHKAPLILRIDDTDANRSTDAAITAINGSLKWLGIEFDATHYQSQRAHIAQDLFEQLKQCERVYECFETPEELALLRKAAMAAGKPPVYPRAGLKLSDAQKAKLRKTTAPHWRFKLSQKRLHWCDELYGEIQTDLASISDPVVVDSSNRILFLLAGIADDLEMGITQIVRGSDHLNGTAIQLDICDAVATKSPPKTVHLPLISGKDHKPLSKRHSEELSVGKLKQAGLEPMGLLNFMVFWGASYESPPTCHSLGELAKAFSLKNTSRASLAVDSQTLERHNTKFIRQMPFSQIKLHQPDMTQQVWDAIAPNIHKMADASRWLKRLKAGYCPLVTAAGSASGSASTSTNTSSNAPPTHSKDTTPEPTHSDASGKSTSSKPTHSDASGKSSPPEPPPIEEPLTKEQKTLIKLAAATPFTDFESWSQTLTHQTGIKGGKLFKPLRLALVGVSRGVAMGDLCQILGAEEITRRLKQAAGQ